MPATNTIHAFDFLERPAGPPVGMLALFGSEALLHQESLSHLIKAWGGDEAEFSTSRFHGEEAQWADLRDALASGSLFAASSPRLVIVGDADEFVSRHRGELESLADRRATTSVLILAVSAWPSNTRLYKLLDQSGLQIDCNLPKTRRGKSLSVDEARVARWLSERSAQRYGFQLPPPSARQLMDLNEINLALYDQQLAKLSCCLAPGVAASPDDVKNYIGGWRSSTVWKLVDAALDGDARTALSLLHGLIQSGENALGLFAQISWSLRRYAGAVEHRDREARGGKSPRLTDCLLAAGFNKYWAGELEAAERRLGRLGLTRGRKLLRMLYHADQALKGTHSSESRSPIVLETLVTQIAQSNG
jgi:DNA polymerase-3 subunit delta